MRWPWAGRDARRVASAPTRVRRFQAAIVNRLTASWQGTADTINQELRGDLDRLQQRSRHLCRNDAYAKRFVEMCRNNIVGPEGFKLHSRVKDPGGDMDMGASMAIENAFAEWSLPRNCDARGMRSFADICRGVVVSLATDGEYLVRKLRGRGAHGYQLQLLSASRLDTRYNVSRMRGRNAVIMGVEVDEASKPLAYHLRASWHSGERQRVPAKDILHGFLPLDPEQVRGVPWLHAVMLELNNMHGYKEAAIIAARVGAGKMGIWETPDGGPPPGAEPDPSGEGETGGGGGDYITDAEPGHFDYAPAGYKLNTYDPTYPHDQFDAFCKATLRGIASGAGVSYHSLGNDLEGVNFSSIRSGTIEERDQWMTLQNTLVSQFLHPVFEDWLDAALLGGAIILPSGKALPAGKRAKFAPHVWQGRRWAWVDPLKDMQAAVVAINNGLASPQQIAMQQGRSIEAVIDELATFQQMLDARGVHLPSRGDARRPGTEAPEKSEAKRFALSVSPETERVTPHE